MDYPGRERKDSTGKPSSVLKSTFSMASDAIFSASFDRLHSTLARAGFSALAFLNMLAICNRLFAIRGSLRTSNSHVRLSIFQHPSSLASSIIRRTSSPTDMPSSLAFLLSHLICGSEKWTDRLMSVLPPKNFGNGNPYNTPHIGVKGVLW